MQRHKEEEFLYKKLQASEEELREKNKEMEAKSEELKTSNEELDATNEELVSANKELNQQTYDLGKRAKELNCIYKISNLVVKQGISLEEILREIIDLIPRAFQYPEITCVRIIINDKEFKTKKFRKTIWKLSSNINVNGKQIGFLEASYMEKKTKKDGGPFLKEEKNLIDAIAKQIGQITERKRAEEALAKSEDRLRTLFNSVPVGLYHKTPEEKILDANLSMAEILHYPDVESLLAINAADLYVNPVDRMNWQVIISREGVVRNFEKQLYWRDGKIIWVWENAGAVRDENGRALYYDGSLEDITERKKAGRSTPQWIPQGERSLLIKPKL